MTAKFKPLSVESSPQQKQSEQLPGAPVNRSRRRLINGVASGAGVLLSVHAKTALGSGVCQSPSAHTSGNLSHTPNQTSCTGGRSPGIWKQPQSFNSWLGVTPATFPPNFNIVSCDTGVNGLKLNNIVTQGTPVTSILSGAPTGSYGVWAVLAFPGSFTDGQLMRHLLSAYLNAGYWPNLYPITRPQVVKMWEGVMGFTTNEFSVAPWTKQYVIDYISGMYDLNPLEMALCNNNA